MKRLLLILQLGLIAITCNVNASIINYDTDDYKAYKDTETELVWLDFGQNNNQSYNDVASQLGTGGEWEGWRLPTFSEVYTMWANVADLENAEVVFEHPVVIGYDMFATRAPNSNIAGGDDSVYEEVFGLIGSNGDVIEFYSTVSISTGVFQGPSGLSGVTAFDETDVGQDEVTVFDAFQLLDSTSVNYDYYLDTADSTASTLLVRQADSPPTDLPAPSTIAILGLGLLGLVARRKLF